MQPFLLKPTTLLDALGVGFGLEEASLLLEAAAGNTSPCPDAPFSPTCPEGIAGRLGGALCRASLERCETRRDVEVQASRFGEEEGLAERAVILRAGSAALLSPSQGCR